MTVEKYSTEELIMDGFGAISVFVAVVERGGFSSAARKLAPLRLVLCASPEYIAQLCDG